MNKCLQCKEETNNPKFCSRSCAAKFNNKIYPKRKAKSLGRCKTCGELLYGKNISFCSRSCIAKYRQEKEFDEYIQKWINGEISGSKGKGGYQITKRVRKYLLIKSNYKCPQCGWDKRNPYTGNITLEIDHIDGDWRNNRPENLRVICLNCHSLTKTFRALNSGKGRGSEMRGSRLYRKTLDKN